MNIVELRQNLSETINQVVYQNKIIEITKHGKPVAALISSDDLKYFEDLEEYLDVMEAKKILEDIKTGKEKTFTFEEVKAELFGPQNDQI